MTQSQRILAKAYSEAKLLREVIAIAKDFGWLVHHTHDSRTNEWGINKGVPDLTLAKDGRTVLIELKKQDAPVPAHQQAWLEASGGHLIRPLDAMTGEVHKILGGKGDRVNESYALAMDGFDSLSSHLHI